MRRLTRFLLWMLGILVPIVIAACYGAPVRFWGRLIDSRTKQPLQGLRVSCIVDGQATEYETSAADGSFGMADTCDSLLVEDIDGTTQGSYATVTVPAPKQGDVELTEVTP